MSPRPRGPPDRVPPELPPVEPAGESAGARWGAEPGAVASGGLEGEPLVGSVVIGDRERRGAARRIAPKSEQSRQRTAPPNRWAATPRVLTSIADCRLRCGSIARQWPFACDLRASPRSRGICRGRLGVWTDEGLSGWGPPGWVCPSAVGGGVVDDESIDLATRTQGRLFSTARSPRGWLCTTREPDVRPVLRRSTYGTT